MKAALFRICISMATHLATHGFVLMAASLLSACGGENATEPAGNQTVPYDPCLESESLEKVMIDDFEAISPLATFTSSNDGTVGAMFTAGRATEALESAKCSTDSAPGMAYHFLGTGFQGYGYSFGFNALDALPDAGGDIYFDATDWDGLSMWVRKGPGPSAAAPSASSIFASVADRYTAPLGRSLFVGEERQELLPPDKCPLTEEPPPMAAPCYCSYDAEDVNGDTVPDALQSQCDRFGAGVGIATDWRFFKIPFARMRQRAFGRPSPLQAPDPFILGVEISLDGENWDFWLDELAFYREPDPAVVAGSN
jgi:hypothetical protein